MTGSAQRLRPRDFPIRLNEAYPCQGVTPAGRDVAFDDLLTEGQRVATFTDRDASFGPLATVIRKPDGLWVELPQGEHHG